MTPRVSWLGRTLGWSGSREQWLGLLGATAWLAGLVTLAVLSRHWLIGSTLLALLSYFALLGLVARDAVNDLFGPVFFYDLLRVSRSPLTFLLRGFYAACLGAFLLLMYFEWMLEQSGHNDQFLVAQMLTFGAVVSAVGSTAVFLLTSGRVSTAIRTVFLVLAWILAGVLLMTAIQLWLNPRIMMQQVETLQTSEISKFAAGFFEAFAVVQWIVLALLTPVTVAGTIAVEKERKTLEFLLATDLRNREIIFGKLASRVLLLVMYVLAGLPLIAFLQLFGGIDPEQLLAATIVAVVTIIGLAAVSIWVSTALKKARDAIVLTYLLIVVYGFVSLMAAFLTSLPFAVGWWNTPVNLFGGTLNLHDIFSFMADGNPFWAFFKLSPLRGGSVGSVLRDYVIFWAFATVLLLASAMLRLRRVTIAQAYGPEKGRRTKAAVHPKAEVEGMATGSEPRPDRSGRPPLEGNPVAWKEVFVDATFRAGCLGRLIGLTILALTFVPLGLIVYYEFFDNYRAYRGSYTFSSRYYYFTQEVNGWVRVVTGVLGFLMFIAAAIRGAGAITGEKDRDSWISLVSTPLSAEQIVWGKWWGCVMSLRRVYFVLLLVWSVGLATGSVMPGMMLVMVPLTLIYVSAFSWVGLYCSLTARNTLEASVRGFFAALFCAGGFWIVVGLCCFLPLNFDRYNYRSQEKLSSFFFGFTPPVVYGIFPLLSGARDMGPFSNNSNYSMGLTGPICGTAFWIVFNFIMANRCLAKCRQIANRGELRRGSDPDRGGNRDSEDRRRDDSS